MFILKKWFIYIFGDKDLQRNYIIVGAVAGVVVILIGIMICVCISKFRNPSPEGAVKDQIGNDSTDGVTPYWKDFIEKEIKENPDAKKAIEKV